MGSIILSGIFIGSTLINRLSACSPHICLPQELAKVQLSDNDVKKFVSDSSVSYVVGSLVMVKLTGSGWRFGIVSHVWQDKTYDILGLDRALIGSHVKEGAIRPLAPLFATLFQPQVDIADISKLVAERSSYYKIHGAPDGHGMILGPSSKIIVLGNLRGNYHALQNHVTELFAQGFIGKNLKLKQDCYLVCLGDYASTNPESVFLISFLLKLQQANQDKVFLLRAGDDQLGLFKQAFYKQFSLSKVGVQAVALAWANMLVVMNQWSKVLLTGLQLPSTHSYDFIMFGHGSLSCSGFLQRLMNNLIKKHIDQQYESPCTQQSYGPDAFAGKEKTTSSLSKFVQKFVALNESTKAYQFYLKAFLCGSLRQGKPGIMRMCDSGSSKMWKALKDRKSYEIGNCTMYTCNSSNQSDSSFGQQEAFGVVEAGRNGRWYIAAHIQ